MRFAVVEATGRVINIIVDDGVEREEGGVFYIPLNENSRVGVSWEFDFVSREFSILRTEKPLGE